MIAIYFLLQTKNGEIEDVEIFNLKNLLNQRKFQHQYDKIDISDLDTYYNKNHISIQNIIPVGDLDFVGKYLKDIHHVDNLNPIEVPTVLQKDMFLGRNYKIVRGNDVPRTGRYFIKNASILKNFSFSGDVSFVSDFIKAQYNYVLSDIVEILSEYRVIVIRDKIEAIQYYDGNPLVFPDIKTIRKSVLTYMADAKRPKAYSMDFAVTQSGTVILEVHPAVSFGTYGYVSDLLPYMYKVGFDYYKNA